MAEEEVNDQTVDSTTEAQESTDSTTDGPQPVGPNEDGDTGASADQATDNEVAEPANDPVLEDTDKDSNLEAARQSALENAPADKPQL